MFSPKGMVSHIKKSIKGGKLHYMPINSKFQYCPPPPTPICAPGVGNLNINCQVRFQRNTPVFYVEVSEGKEFTFVSR